MKQILEELKREINPELLGDVMECKSEEILDDEETDFDYSEVEELCALPHMEKDGIYVIVSKRDYNILMQLAITDKEYLGVLRMVFSGTITLLGLKNENFVICADSCNDEFNPAEFECRFVKERNGSVVGYLVRNCY